MSETAAISSRREQAKSGRRARIVDAAWTLLREVGVEAVSVAMIAERADVSPATVYNLFGTKAAILEQVFDQDLAAFQVLVAQAPAVDSLDRIFKSIAIAASLYSADPGFYRAMVGVGRGAGALYSDVSEPRIGFWRGMVEKARADGCLRAEADAAILAVTLAQIARGALSEWAAGVIPAERLEIETAYGFAVVLSAYASKAAAPALRERIGVLEARLAAGDRRGSTGASRA